MQNNSSGRLSFEQKDQANYVAVQSSEISKEEIPLPPGAGPSAHTLFKRLSKICSLSGGDTQ